jgi:anti-sigma B factor antagonist
VSIWRLIPVPASGPELEIRVEETDDTYVVRLLGELDLSGVPEVNEALAAAEASGARSLLVDIEELTFVDSTGLSALLRVSRRNDGRLLFTRGSGHVAEMLRMTGIDQSLPFRLAPDRQAES